MKNEYINNVKFEKTIKNFQNIKRNKDRYEMLIEDLKIMYINNKTDMSKNKLEQYEQLLDEVYKNYKIIQEELAISFYMLAEKLAKYKRFNLIDVDDAIQEGVFICFDKIDRFNPIFGKAFNYMTTCIINHYKQLYRGAKGQEELKRKYGEYIYDKSDTIIKNGKETFNRKNENFF